MVALVVALAAEMVVARVPERARAEALGHNKEGGDYSPPSVLLPGAVNYAAANSTSPTAASPD